MYDISSAQGKYIYLFLQLRENLKMETSIKNKLYQMFILGLEGEDLRDNPNLIKALHQGLGGVIFFTQNIKTKDQFKNLVKNIKKEAQKSNNPPPILSIDQEGGRVERTENIFGGKKFLSAKYAAQNGEKFVKEQTEQISLLLKDLGLNLNFAPVLDVNTNPDNPIIGERAFSNNTDEVINFGKVVVETYLKNDIIPCTKHFPGHGDASVDSHIALPKFDLPLEEMEKIHIRPFKEVISPMIMVAHMHCTCFNKDEIPTSLSKNAINYLRNNLKFDGIIISDDMIMGGVNEKNKAAEMAIKAGVNILLYRNSANETIQIIENLAELAKTDEELKNNIDKSYKKIIDFKNKFGL